MEIIELKNTLSKIKLLLDGLDNRMEMTEGRVGKLEDRLIKVIQPNKEREKNWKQNEKRLRDLWDNIKRSEKLHISDNF